MQFFRPHDQTGLNVFETNKTDTVPFTGLKVRIGGAFSQDYQSLTDKNTASYIPTNTNPSKGAIDSTNANKLAPLGGGFDLGFANMNLDVQLADGIRTNVTIYLASEHHEDTWVKNGYLQVDKMLFLNSNLVNDAMKYLTFQVGDLEVDYGDQHYRRVDGGNETCIIPLSKIILWMNSQPSLSVRFISIAKPDFLPWQALRMPCSIRP